MQAFEVVRRPGVLGNGGGPECAAREYKVLSLAHAAGIAVPKPRLLEASTGTLVLDYVEGELEGVTARSEPSSTGRRPSSATLWRTWP